MATIGLDKPFYAKITEDAEGVETYGTPQRMAKAISANMTIEYAEGTLDADDAVSEAVKLFKSGSLSLGIDDKILFRSGVGSPQDEHHRFRPLVQQTDHVVSEDLPAFALMRICFVRPDREHSVK